MAGPQSDSKCFYSLKSYHVSEELGFILPDPLVSRKATFPSSYIIRILPYTPILLYRKADAMTNLIAAKPSILKRT